MTSLLIAAILSISNPAHAGMDKYGNPTLDAQFPTYVPSAYTAEETLPEPKTDREIYYDGLLFMSELLYFINNYYYKEIDVFDCITKIAKAGVSECTDRYSFYLDPVETKREQESFIDGKMAGIGTSLELNEWGGVKILKVFEDSPAEKVGLLENDVIAKVSEGVSEELTSWVDLEKMPLDKVVGLIRGKEGTTVKLLIVRGNEQKTFIVTRGIVKIPFLRSKMLKEKVGYIHISEFGGEVSKQFHSAMEKLDSDGAQAIILDLRNNGGGKMDAVLEMSALFAKTNKSYATILYIKGKQNQVEDMTVNNAFVGRFKKKKVIVLQNGNSASASEIFSGYLKYETDAIIIGEKSYGKGIIQHLVSLSNKGRLHLTVAEYFIGSKSVKVHGVGISPTIEMKPTKRAKNEAEDELLQRAILEAEKLLK